MSQWKAFAVMAPPDCGVQLAVDVNRPCERGEGKKGKGHTCKLSSFGEPHGRLGKWLQTTRSAIRTDECPRCERTKDAAEFPTLWGGEFGAV